MIPTGDDLRPPVLSLEEAVRGMNAALATASADGTPIVVVVSDYRGEMACSADRDYVAEITKITIKRIEDGLILGGIGVSGPSSGARDEEIARLAVDAMGLRHR